MRLVVHLDPVVRFKSGSRTGNPNPLTASLLLDNAGADGIIVSPSGNLANKDIALIRSASNSHINVEIPVNQDSVRSALEVKPDMVTLIPENGHESNGEVATNGHAGLREYISSLHAASVDVAIMISADLKSVKEARNLNADAVSIDVSPFTAATNSSDALYHLEGIESASLAANKLGLQVSVFGGINDKNIANLVNLDTIDEIVLGHEFFARALFLGLDRAFSDLREQVRYLSGRNS